MSNKETVQNNLIELIEDWIMKGKPLGLSGARDTINEYEKVVENLTLNKIKYWIEESILERDSSDDGVIDHESNANYLLNEAIKLCK